MQAAPPPQQPSPRLQQSHSSFSCHHTTLSLYTLKDPKAILYTLLAISLLSLIFILYLSSSPHTVHSGPDPFLFPIHQTQKILKPTDPVPPSIAYLISGSKGDSGRILRLLYVTYHPRNHYLLHLDLLASQSERDSLAWAVQSVPIFKAAQNVDVIGKADFAYAKGSSPISSTLHGASILLRLSSTWDWFVSLNAGDYPLVTQDGIVVCSIFAGSVIRSFSFFSYADVVMFVLLDVRG